MNSIVNHMSKYGHRQHVLSDWLAELEQRFQLGEVDTDKSKITWCQLLIGATGSSILAELEDDASWEAAKETLLSRLGIGSVREVQKLGCCTMEEVVAAARRIERILGEQPDSKMEQLILSMQDQICILTKDLKSAHEQMASKSAAATPTAALARRDGGCCSTTPCRLAACHGHRSPASCRSTTPTSYRAAVSLPTCPSIVSRLRGRGTIFSATTPTAR